MRFVLFLMVSVLLLQLGCASAPPEQASRPNIVIILADDLGWNDVGFHGSAIRTPNLDALAESGTRLSRFYVMPVCSPTRGALMTGRYPFRLGLQCGVVRPWAQHGLPLNERTLADALGEVGYRTAVVGKWHLGHNDPAYLPLQRGFDQQYGCYNGAIDYFTHIRDGGYDWHRNDERCDDAGYITDLTGDEAVRIIAEHDQADPLFLYVPFNAPHTPNQAPQEVIARNEHIENQRQRIFAAMVTSMDDAIGRIVAQLRDSGFDMDNTLIFFSSDNGGIVSYSQPFDWRGQKGTLYEGGVRSPAVIAWPGRVEGGAVIDEPMHIVDLYPTLLRLAGAELDQELPLDGQDVWPTITAGAPSPHDHIVLNASPFTGAVTQGQWKLVWNGQVSANATALPENERWELFNLEADPGEQDNRYDEYARIARPLRELLQRYQSEAAPPNIPPNRPPAGFRSPAVWGE